MTTLTWASLAIFALAVTGGALLVTVRALEAWHALRSFRRRLGTAVDEALALVADAERRLAHAAESAARLDAARRRLEAALRVAALLAGATGDARAIAGAVRGIVPRK